MENTARTFVALAKEHLSIPGETLPQFAAELKRLTAQDRADLTAGFEAMGYKVAEPAKA